MRYRGCRNLGWVLDVLVDIMPDNTVVGMNSMNVGVYGAQKMISSMFGWNCPGGKERKLKSNTVKLAKTRPRKAIFNKQRVTKSKNPLTHCF